MKILTFTTLFPNAAAPGHGVFVENRLAATRKVSDAEFKVLAPVPWFPSTSALFGHYARFAAAPLAEERLGIEVRHPRYFVPPRIGMTYAARSLARAALSGARALIAEGWDFDLIDAHYLYPDGVAAIRLGAALGKPVVLTARGSDVTLLPAYPRQRQMILDALRRADAIIAVAGALKKDLVALGAPAEKISVLRNGVDLDRFRPMNREEIRRKLGLSGKVFASVGSLIERKGHDIAMRASAAIDDATLLVVGEGPERKNLQKLSRSLGTAERVRFLGAVSHESLTEIYNAADALILASSREGWPNVLLEAMACGAPAVASNAGGCAEVISEERAGRIVASRQPDDFASALIDAVHNCGRKDVRAFAETRSWDETAQSVAHIFRNAIERSSQCRAIRYAPIVENGRDKPSLIFTVDTEEEFNWSEFSPAEHRISSPENIDRLQRLCASHGVKPVYFLTYPLLRDRKSAAYFRGLHESGLADLGIHPHQWNVPPSDSFKGEYYSWQSNLPPEIHLEKLRSIKRAFEDAFGFSPIAHRAGRYGIAPAAYRELAEIGVTHDFSPSAAFDFSSSGGPDFSGVSNCPFVAETDLGKVFVTPVCGAWALRGTRAFLKQRREPGLACPHRALPRQFVAPFRLTCERARYSELVSLTCSLQKERAPVLTFGLHSTTMTPGGNPYAPDAASVDAALAVIGRYLEFFTRDFEGRALSFSDLDALYRDDINLNPSLRAAS